MQTLPINISGVGTFNIVPGIFGASIAIYRLLARATSGMTITFLNGATALTGPLPFVTAQEIHAAEAHYPLFDCSPGNAFRVTKTSTSAFTGCVWFIQE